MRERYPEAFHFKATLLTPMTWHSLYAKGGTATLASVLGDKALCYACAETLGLLRPGPALPSEPNYARDLDGLPFKASLFLSDDAVLLPPETRRYSAEAETPMGSRVSTAMSSGNVKGFFSTQPVEAGALYTGWFFGTSPSSIAGSRSFCVRTGLHREALVLLEEIPGDGSVVLNAHTAALFGSPLPASRTLLHGLRPSRGMTVSDARREVGSWERQEGVS